MLFLYNCLNNIQLHNIFDGVICLFPMHHSTFHVTLPFWCTSTEVPNSDCLKVSTVLLCTVIFDIRRQKCLKTKHLFIFRRFCLSFILFLSTYLTVFLPNYFSSRKVMFLYTPYRYQIAKLLQVIVFGIRKLSEFGN